MPHFEIYLAIEALFNETFSQHTPGKTLIQTIQIRL